MLGFKYNVQVYKRGPMFMCDIEKRFEDLDEAISWAEEMLNKYEDGNREAMREDFYSPHNFDGYWYTEREYGGVL
jgi:hypothetical protein